MRRAEDLLFVTTLPKLPALPESISEHVREQHARQQAEQEERIKDYPRQIRELLTRIADICQSLELPLSRSQMLRAADDLPQTSREAELLFGVLRDELKSVTAFFVPSLRAKYYERDDLNSEAVRTAFPIANSEMRRAANCIAAGYGTAAVFHAMRAAEIGVQSLAIELGVSFSFPVQLAEWGNLLDQIDKKIADMKQLPRGTKKDEDLKFFSEAAVQLRYFKDAWRIRVAHARESYDEAQALSVFQHTQALFESLATRVKEP